MNYNHLSDLLIQGKVYSAIQGDLIGSKTTMPNAEDASGQTILYLGTTNQEFTQGKYYHSDGTSWALSPASSTTPDITVDDVLSTSSTNPVQNRVVAERFAEIQDDIDAIGSGGQANTIEKITLNGTEVPVDSKTAKITVNRSTVDLSNVDNTSDKAKPISDATQSALDNKIGGVKVNGSALTPDASHAVNIDLSGYATKSDVSSIPKFAISVVDDLPTSGISASTIYLKVHGGSESDNIYDEFIYVNSKWELIGTTKTDLTQYATKTEVQSKQDKVIFAQDASVTWAEDSSISGFGYKGTVNVTGMTADHEPIVCFNGGDAVSGRFCSVAESGSGTVYIWSKDNNLTKVPVISGILKV